MRDFEESKVAISGEDYLVVNLIQYYRIVLSYQA